MKLIKATDPVPEPGQPRRKRRLRQRFRCAHVLQVWTWGPHPRYGDQVPFCAPSLIPHPSCGC
jgi:hypothetical protein